MCSQDMTSCRDLFSGSSMVGMGKDRECRMTFNSIVSSSPFSTTAWLGERRAYQVDGGRFRGRWKFGYGLELNGGTN